MGDNDSLGAIVAACCQADLLVLLSDIDGLYRQPQGRPECPAYSGCGGADAGISLRWPETKGSELATGGMVTKLHAARIATEQGVSMVISNGAVPEHLTISWRGSRWEQNLSGRKRV